MGVGLDLSRQSKGCKGSWDEEYILSGYSVHHEYWLLGNFGLSETELKKIQNIKILFDMKLTHDRPSSGLDIWGKSKMAFALGKQC